MLLQHVLHLVIYALAVMACARIVPGIHVKSFTGALWFALAFVILDKLLFWVLVMVSFPMIVLSLGLFVFVINAFLIAGLIGIGFWLQQNNTVITPTPPRDTDHADLKCHLKHCDERRVCNFNFFKYRRTKQFHNNSYFNRHTAKENNYNSARHTPIARERIQ